MHSDPGCHLGSLGHWSYEQLNKKIQSRPEELERLQIRRDPEESYVYPP